MRFPNAMTRYARPAAIALGLALVTAVALMSSLGDDAAVQEPESGIRPIEWPPFVATYKTDIRSLSISGVRQTGHEVRQIEWNSTYNWKVTVLSSPQLGRYNATGTWWEQRGNVYRHYDTWDREPAVVTEVLPEHHFYLPPSGVFFPHLYSNDDFDIRTDGDLVILNVEYCDFSSCDAPERVARDAAGEPVAPTPALLQGRRFEGTPVVLSDDAHRIPLQSGHLRVTQLHTNPATPTHSTGR